MIQIKSFYAHNDLRNFSYLLYEDNTGAAWIIDPYEALPMIKYIKENSLRLQGILNTHSHFDHIRGNAPLIEAFKSPVTKLRDKEAIHLSSEVDLETLDTPGHTADHQVFLLKEKQKTRALFSGDTLFNSGVGNCRNGGNVDQLYSTTMKLIATLPGEVLLYPGHDYAERNLEFALTVEPENQQIKEQLKETKAVDAENRRVRKLLEEKLVNPFLRLDSEEIKRSFQTEMDERNLFQQLRSLRDKW